MGVSAHIKTKLIQFAFFYLAHTDVEVAADDSYVVIKNNVLSRELGFFDENGLSTNTKSYGTYPSSVEYTLFGLPVAFETTGYA